MRGHKAACIVSALSKFHPLGNRMDVSWEEDEDLPAGWILRRIGQGGLSKE